MNITMADLKLVKVGERYKCQSRAKHKINERVETRRRVCKRCGKILSKEKYAHAQYCSTLCAGRQCSYNYRLSKGLIKKPGVGSGHNQGLGRKHHSYKNGIANFSQKAFAHYGKKCQWCGSIDYLVVHHKDHNRDNNSLRNLVVLCKQCHQEHHTKRSPRTGRYIKG